ncbi:hypothetical protein [Vacuolonema iberomarrocanum]|uniref:hypothetical protein n=1 Tax=Vacuolonema iberomarrocanum TaxID=3454632 RepID=UPI001A0FE7C9|nr:hypothetical protein [filamentous cyanobacterium LEGE 07170]
MTDFPMALLCPVLIWVMLVGFFLSVCFAMRDSMVRLKRLHQIPCSRCDFFTGDYRLKCTVHPCKVMSEDAIGCLDYEPASSEKVGRSPAKPNSRCA